MASASTLWPIFIFSLAAAWMSDRRSAYTLGRHGEKQRVNKDRFFFAILLISMALFIGLREWCNDTGTYRDGYEYFTRATGPILEGVSWKLGHSPAFEIVNTILKHIGFSSQDFLMFYALVTVGLYLWFLWKHSTDFWLSVFLLWTMGVYLFAAAGMRQAAAIAVALIGVDRALDKKWIPFVAWVVIAALFHPYALMFLLAPLLMFAPWTGRTWLLLGIFAVIGFSLQHMVGTILDITSMMGRNYDPDAFSGEGVNIFRLLVVWAPIVLSFLAQNHMQGSRDEKNNLFMNFSMLNAEIMFVALFGTANYFARLANYFLLFQTLALPWMFQFFNRRSQRLLKSTIVVCYLVYFIFANVILTPFNTYFAKMSLWDYLSTLF